MVVTLLSNPNFHSMFYLDCIIIFIINFLLYSKNINKKAEIN